MVKQTKNQKTMIKKHIKGTPKAQPRPRFNRMTRRVYNPNTADYWKSTIKAELLEHKDKKLIGAFKVYLHFYFKRPASHFGTGKNKHIPKPSSPVRHHFKPDVDNLAKSVLDCLTSLGLWGDDSQVIELKIMKDYADVFPEGCYMEISKVERAVR